MDDNKQYTACEKPLEDERCERKISLRIAIVTPAGEAIIRLTCPEEALSWDSAL